MTIVDAINRAKQMQRDKHSQQNRVTGDERRSAVDPAAPIVAPTTPVPGVSPAIATPITAIGVDIDAAACGKNRILMPGFNDLLNGKVDSAYRMLRTRVLQRARAQGWTTIGITSACPNDGKTLTAVNLALCLARDKSSEVTLLDLDMRNPSICKSLGFTPANQIADFLGGSIGTAGLFSSLRGIEGLYIAGGTRSTDHSSELLASPKFEELIGHIKMSTLQPLVIIDLPPILATDDALVLAPRLDAILVVTSEGQTEREQLGRALDHLRDFNVAGLVLNRSRYAAQGYDEYY
jgi:protein-tyrosine kinase